MDVSGCQASLVAERMWQARAGKWPTKEAQQGQMGTVEVGRAEKGLMKSELHWTTGSQE